ncbi:GNAT family N-acetyltransferase [Streptococcus oricebi]|uniref:GNAT family N-acetyltransferase n=1 Tax=Streptococcus oricebi TaxID=1547447 RepID=A0ABS5B1K3_9STRE|nr:GNAT family N-acetyltransferase [Streptococcus oricebi]MBP2622712.1 GNAT family N-acetyltransferase [Streptococcus oricebi]
MWYVKKLEQLTSREFYDLLKLRIETFIVEQERIYQELDEQDLLALHIFHRDEAGKLDAYGRLFEDGEDLVFGRVLTSLTSRGQGLGGQLVEKILTEAERRWPGRQIRIKAQEQVVGLYQKYGFEISGPSLILEGTPHLPMIYKIKNKP